MENKNFENENIENTESVDVAENIENASENTVAEQPTQEPAEENTAEQNGEEAEEIDEEQAECNAYLESVINEQPPEHFSPLWYLSHNLKMRAPKAAIAWNKVNATSKIINGIFAAILLLAVAVVGYYIFGPAKGNYHSDTTDTILWAQATLESKSLFNKDFCYACILPIGGHLIMLPYVAMFGVSVTAQSWGMFTFFLIFVISLFGMLKKVGMNFKWTCLTTSFTILLVSGSEKLREIFWDHVIYYSLGLLFAFIGIILISACIDKLNAGKGKVVPFGIYSGLLFLWCFLTGLNQIESLTIFLLPAFAAVVAERFFANDKAKTAYVYFGNIIIGAAILFGSALGYITCNKMVEDLKITAGYESAYSGLSTIDKWNENFETFYSHWVSLFGVEIENGMKFLEGKTIVELLEIVVCVILVIAPIIMLFMYKKIENRKMRILLLFHWFMTALIMMGFIVGLLASANWRLSPILCTSIIITFALAKVIFDTADVKRIGLVFVLPLALVGALTAKSIVDMPADYKQDEGIYKIVNDLEGIEQTLGVKLDYGYATFWHANVITLITDEEIPVRSINVTDIGYHINTYQTQMDWYEDQDGVENYFVLLSPAEFNTVFPNAANGDISSNHALANPELGLSQTYYQISEGFYVLVYSNNIF